MSWPILDSHLPTLPLVLDATAVSRRFCQAWPAAAGPTPVVQACRRQEIQYTPPQQCVATYKLCVEPVGAAPYETMVVVEATPTGISQRSFTADPHLVGLATAGQVAAMQERFALLAAQYGEASNHTQNQAAAGPLLGVTPLRYKPGVRCALRYLRQSAQGPTLYFGKLMAQGSAQLARTITTLDRASQAEPLLPHIAPLLAYWPDLQMVLQAAMPGAELHTVAFDERLDMTTRKNWLWLAGRTLAALHSLQLRADTPGVGAQQRLVDDVAGLIAYAAALRQADPALAARYGEAATALTHAAARQTEEAAVISHGALRTDQFLLDGAHLVLIDLDSVCWASPARDLGNLLAYLTWKAVRQPQHAAFIRQAKGAFLAGYQTLRPQPEAAWLACYEAVALLKIIGRRYTGLTVREWPLTAGLLAQTVTIISHYQ